MKKKVGANKISDLPDREYYWDLEPSQNGPCHPNWQGGPYKQLTLKARLKCGEKRDEDY